MISRIYCTFFADFSAHCGKIDIRDLGTQKPKFLSTRMLMNENFHEFLALFLKFSFVKSDFTNFLHFFLRIFRAHCGKIDIKDLGTQKPKFLSTRMLMNENFLWKPAAYQSQNVFQTQTERCQKVGHLRFTQFL